MAFMKLARVDEIPQGSMKKIVAGEKELLIVNLAGRFYAMNNRCWHMNGDLSTGKLEGNIVTCPKHGSQFDVTSGKGIRGPKVAFIKMKERDIPSYETKIEGSDILVNL